MNSTNSRVASASRRPQRLVLLAGALLSALLGATTGCQSGRGSRSEPARILFDSLLAANEAMYTSNDPNLGYDLRGCVYRQAVETLGREDADRLSGEAENAVRSRHSRTEWEAVSRGLAGDHPYSTPEFCARIDSLWNARTTAKPAARP